MKCPYCDHATPAASSFCSECGRELEPECGSVRYLFGRLPFSGSIFWKVLLVVAVLATVAWVLIVRLTDYEMGPQDYGGSVISGIIFAYWVHLWLLPQEEFEDDFEEGDWEGQEAEQETRV